MPEETGADAESRSGARRRAHHSPPRFFVVNNARHARKYGGRTTKFPHRSLRQSEIRETRSPLDADFGLDSQSLRVAGSQSLPRGASHRWCGLSIVVLETQPPPAFARNLSQQPSSRGLGPKKPTVFFVSSFFCIAHPLAAAGVINMQASRARKPFARLRAFRGVFFGCLFHWFFVQG